MNPRLYFLKELLYGALLYTLITAPHDVIVEIHLNEEPLSNLMFNFPGIGMYLIGSIIFTAVVLLSRRFRCHVVFLTAWIALMCIKFMVNVRRVVHAIREVSPYKQPSGPIMGLVIYCGLFTMALELMLHWLATGWMMPHLIVINIAVYRGIRRHGHHRRQ